MEASFEIARHGNVDICGCFCGAIVSLQQYVVLVHSIVILYHYWSVLMRCMASSLDV